MMVSVVVCCHTIDRYGDLIEAVESVLDQTHELVETIIVVDGDDSLCERLERDYQDRDDITVLCNEENRGLSASRNRGLTVATGDVVAFLDDDAVADRRWLEELVSVYEAREVEAVGGRMTPIWVGGKPSFLPEEFYWLVGVTHRGFPEEGPVRNTFGSNISFRAEVLENLGGFETGLGRKGTSHRQGEETELATRLRSELDGTLYYTPRAEVGHKVFDYRLRVRWLLKRAFWQGYSKRLMASVGSGGTPEEAAFLESLFVESIPRRLVELARRPTFARAAQLGSIVAFTAAVGAGYLYGIVRSG